MYPYSSIIQSYKRMKNWYMLQHDELWKYVKWKQPVRKEHLVWFCLYDTSLIANSIEVESRLVTRAWRGEGNGDWLLMGRGVLFKSDENVPKLDSDDGCTTLWLH